MSTTVTVVKGSNWVQSVSTSRAIFNTPGSGSINIPVTSNGKQCTGIATLHGYEYRITYGIQAGDSGSLSRRKVNEGGGDPEDLETFTLDGQPIPEPFFCVKRREGCDLLLYVTKTAAAVTYSSQRMLALPNHLIPVKEENGRYRGSVTAGGKKFTVDYSLTKSKGVFLSQKTDGTEDPEDLETFNIEGQPDPFGDTLGGYYANGDGSLRIYLEASCSGRIIGALEDLANKQTYELEGTSKAWSPKTKIHLFAMSGQSSKSKKTRASLMSLTAFGHAEKRDDPVHEILVTASWVSDLGKEPEVNSWDDPKVFTKEG